MLLLLYDTIRYRRLMKGHVDNAGQEYMARQTDACHHKGIEAALFG